MDDDDYINVYVPILLPQHRNVMRRTPVQHKPITENRPTTASGQKKSNVIIVKVKPQENTFQQRLSTKVLDLEVSERREDDGGEDG